MQLFPPFPLQCLALERFPPITIQELTNLVSTIKTSSRPRDIVPTSFSFSFLLVHVCSLLSITRHLVHPASCQTSTCTNTSQTNKKTNLNLSLPQDYRPISKSFVAKVLEKVFSKQLRAVLKGAQHIWSFSLVSIRLHSTETALLSLKWSFNAR